MHVEYAINDSASALSITWQSFKPTWKGGGWIKYFEEYNEGNEYILYRVTIET
jgi:hypothetical protein